MPFEDYYQVLGVERGASPDEIRASYRRLARRYHPDRNREAGAEERFKKVGEAYEVLKDPEKRALYDRFGERWRQAEAAGAAGAEGPGFEEIRFEDLGGSGLGGLGSIFERIFRGASGGAPFGGDPAGGWTARGADREARLTLDLEEAARGGEREITLEEPGGGGRRTLRARFPRGVRPGQRIRLSGQGGPGLGGGPPGDLFLRVEIAPHARFRLEGDALHTTLDLPPWVAALGGEVSVPTLDGSVRVKVPEGSSSGRRIRLRGKGFPRPGGGVGDLYAEIRIVLGGPPSERARRLYQELAAEARAKVA
jgi:curved DNA-binding protein